MITSRDVRGRDEAKKEKGEKTERKTRGGHEGEAKGRKGGGGEWLPHTLPFDIFVSLQSK
jgi:hypothetical protein